MLHLHYQCTTIACAWTLFSVFVTHMRDFANLSLGRLLKRTRYEHLYIRKSPNGGNRGVDMIVILIQSCDNVTFCRGS